MKTMKGKRRILPLVYLSGIVASVTFAPITQAQVQVEAELAAYSGYIDRGEQLAEETISAALTFAKELGVGELSLEFSRVAPAGDNSDQFEDMFDTTLAFGAQTGWGAYGVSATWLNYPGEDAQSSVELGAEVEVDAPFSPALAAFYDTRFDDFGAEVTAGPSAQLGDFDVYGLLRAGFVHPGGGGDYAYGGVETGIGRDLRPGVNFNAFLRHDFSDEDLYVGSSSDLANNRFVESALTVGVALSFNISEIRS